MSEDIIDSTTEVEEEIKPKMKGRRKDGTFRKGVSGNKLGRPRGSTGKLSETRLTNILQKYGPFAAEKIIEIANSELKKGNTNTSLKAYALVFDKYVQAVHKQQAADLKEATAKLVDEDEEDNNTNIQPVVFTMAANS